MSKPKGARGRDYGAKRLALLRRATDLVLSTPGDAMSMRQIAQGCGVTIPTLNHYFSDRSGVFEAILEQSWRDAEKHLAAAAEPEGDFPTCVHAKLCNLADGFSSYGVDKLNAWGIAVGLEHTLLGPAYLTYFLEPTLQAAESWLRHYQEAGEVSPTANMRYAALALYAPLITIFMHQNSLGGCHTRPADIDDFIECHAASFVKSLRSSG
jgi:AcrR family transcriptional regulator